MEIRWDGQDYLFNLEDITVSQAKVIKVNTGLTLMTMEEALENADPDALKAVFWLMMTQNAVAIPFERVDFKIIDFAKALQEGSEKQAEKEAAEQKAAEEAGTAEAPKDQA